MLDQSKKIYSYFFEDLSVIEKKLLSLESFDYNMSGLSELSDSVKNRILILSNIFKKSDPKEYWPIEKQLLKLIDIKSVDELLANPNFLTLNNTNDNLIIINASLGGEDVFDKYSTDEVNNIFNKSRQNFDYVTLINSLRQEITNRYDRKLIKAIFDYLKKYDFNKSWEIKDIVVFVLSLNIVWKNYEFLLPAEQEYLLKLFFYLSVFIGVPVSNVLIRSVYNTNNPVDFVLKHKFIYDNLKENIEVVPQDETLTKFFDLKEIFENFALSNASVDNFLKENYNTKSKNLISTLSEALKIYEEVKNSNLIEKNYAGEVNIADNFDFQLSELLSWFSAKSEWEKIISYFQMKPLVPANVFIKNIKEFVDLNKTDAANKVLEFFEVLKQKQIIPDRDFLIFHESDNQFHWNEKIV